MGAILGLPEPGEKCFAGQGRAEQVRVEHPPPLGLRKRANLPGRAHAGGVHQQRERRPLPAEPVVQGGPAGGVADVARMLDHARGEVAGSERFGQVDRGHEPAIGSEPIDDGSTETAGRPADDCRRRGVAATGKPAKRHGTPGGRETGGKRG